MSKSLIYIDRAFKVKWESTSAGKPKAVVPFWGVEFKANLGGS